MSKVKEKPLAHIALAKIRENPVALRSVDRQDEKWLGLVDSVKANGVLNPILVREIKDPDTGEILYGLIDGLQRFSACQEAGLAKIPAMVTDLNDAEILEAQIITNVQRVETKPSEYSEQLRRILAQNPTLTISELAAKLSKSPAWLGDRLSLTKLTPQISSLVDEGKVNLSNAYALAKLPIEEQVNFLDRSMTMTPQEFVPTVTARVNQIREASRKGRDAAPAEFVAVPHLRKVAEMKDEADNKVAAKTLTNKLKVASPIDAFHLGVLWAMHLDPDSVEIAKAKDAARKAELAAAKLKRQEERKTRAEQEAAEEAALASV